MSDIILNLKKKPELVSTLNDIPATAREQLVVILNQVLADMSDLYSQAKQAHWNVRGTSFYSLHLLFDQVAASAEEPLDDIAERVVQLGGVAEGTVRQTASRSALPEFPTEGANGAAYAQVLAERFAAVAKSVRAAVDVTAELGDTGSSDLLTGVSRALDKSLWFIEAHTRQ